MPVMKSVGSLVWLRIIIAFVSAFTWFPRFVLPISYNNKLHELAYKREYTQSYMGYHVGK
jgi:hypothetical protein